MCPQRISHAGCALCLLFAFVFLSCTRNTVSQDENIYQGALQATEDIEETYRENTQITDIATIATTLTNLTLIPSVEPELLRNVMPNSWRRLERLTEVEEQAFIIENINALLEMERPLRNVGRHNYFSIYRHQVGIDIFYRVLITENSNPDFMSHSIQFHQFLVYRNEILTDGRYNATDTATQSGFIGYFTSIDIITGGERANGVLVTELRLWVYGSPVDMSNWIEYVSRRNNQISGGNESSLYLMDDLRDGIRSPIRITASDCLVDPVIPLRHSLQNAFDGNPETAFVANAEDGLMNISIATRDLPVRRIAIINGCAKGMTSYKDNNRLRTISTSFNRERRDIVLYDDTLSWQKIDNATAWFSVREIFPGYNYDNTLVAGFNVFIENQGWLFGGIDGQ